MPLQEAPSTHILKFEIPDYRNVPAFETYTTLLAKATGLPTVDLEYKRLGKDSYIVIRRYDRQEAADGKIQRLHQEDFCQALGYGYQYKYEEDGGPNFSQCYQLIQNASTDPLVDTQNLLRWQIFNFLAGNSDGHAKNISLIYFKNQQTRLAPFYDLVCTRAIERIDERLAFSVAGERDPHRITLEHWAAEANLCDLGPRYLQSLVTDSAQKILQQLPEAKHEFVDRFGEYPALQRIEQTVTRQCTRLLKAALN